MPLGQVRATIELAPELDAVDARKGAIGGNSLRQVLGAIVNQLTKEAAETKMGIEGEEGTCTRLTLRL